MAQRLTPLPEITTMAGDTAFSAVKAKPFVPQRTIGPPGDGNRVIQVGCRVVRLNPSRVPWPDVWLGASFVIE
jgi:hypothetical protein